MKKSKLVKNLIIASVVVVLFLSCGIAYANTIYSKSKNIGQEQAQIFKNKENNNAFVATVNGEKITKKEFDLSKIAMSQNGKTYSDKEILDKIIGTKVLYQKTIIAGITVTDDEINNVVNNTQNMLKQNAEESEFLDNYIKGLGITTEQYWDNAKLTYKESIAVGKFYESLKLKFQAENNITNSEELNTKFNEYYKNFRQNLISKAEIQTDIK